MGRLLRLASVPSGQIGRGTEVERTSFCTRVRRRPCGEDVDIGRSARGLKLCVVQSAATMPCVIVYATSYTSADATPCRDSVITRSILH